MRTAAEAEAHVRLRVQESADFASRLVENPRAVILAETGVDLSDGKLAFVNEEIRKALSDISELDRVLTDGELEQISAAGCKWDPEMGAWNCNGYHVGPG